MLTKQQLKVKCLATFYRLFFSILIISLIIIPLYLIWYPAPLSVSLNIHKLIAIIFIIDVGLAALLTFLFFNPNRKDNALNMLIITILQVVAFCIGFYYFAQVRPSWLVQHEDRVYVIQPAFIIYPDNMSLIDRMKLQSWGMPRFQTVKFSDIPQQQQNQLYLSVAGEGIEYQPLEYLDFDQSFALTYAKPISTLYALNSVNEVKNLLSEYVNQEIFWLPLRSSPDGIDMVVLLNGKGQTLKIVDLKPW